MERFFSFMNWELDCIFFEFDVFNLLFFFKFYRKRKTSDVQLVR